MKNKNNFEIITQEEAKKLMRLRIKYTILDVRRKAEYDKGHIPNSINVPLSLIVKNMLNDIPNKDELILVYCRSGRRSKKASNHLSSLGYSNIKEFGGILDWDGEIVTD